MKKNAVAEKYARLSAFLRTYLHEDFQLEYGSAENAADNFRDSAGPEKTAAVAHELAEFLSAAEAVPFKQAQTWWTRELGSAWLPSDTNQIRALHRRLSKAP
jgi:hypothetical protein